MTPRRSLSSGLLLLTVVIVLAASALAFVPGLARERRDYLGTCITQAHVAALSLAAAPGGRVDDATRDELLRLSGVSAIRVTEPGRGELTLAGAGGPEPGERVDLRVEGGFMALRRAVDELIHADGRLIRVTGQSRLHPGATVELTLPERALSKDLRIYAWESAQVAVTIAVVTGAIIYLALLRLLVRPMRRLTRGIAAFRADPEHAAAIRVSRTPLGEDEIAAAERELGAMQSDLRAALWRNARLAALGTAMAQVSHDLRGILSPALIVADKLGENPDPAISRAGDTIVRMVDRATNLVQSMLDFAREGPAATERRPVAIRGVLDETIEGLRASAQDCAFVNDVPHALRAEADREQLLRALGNLCRNALEAGARRLRVSASPPAAAEDGESVIGPMIGPMIGIDVEDDGPGLPERVRATLFRPFSHSTKPGGTGLGLAIARDLVRAQGGELELVRTGPAGTAFRVLLPATAEAALSRV